MWSSDDKIEDRSSGKWLKQNGEMVLHAIALLLYNVDVQFKDSISFPAQFSPEKDIADKNAIFLSKK